MTATPAPRRPAAAAGGPRRSILLIEDMASLQMAYRGILQGAGHRVITAASAGEARALVESARPDAVVLDLMLPDADGLELLQDILRLRPGVAVVVVTADRSIPRAVEAMRLGAHDFIVKPAEQGRLLSSVDTALSRGAASAGKNEARNRPIGMDFIGTSPAMQRVEATIASVAASMATVFITGESGTGKELAALAVHRRSNRANGPFIALNCGAIPQDLLESEVFGHVKGSFTGAIANKPGAAAAADGGTLFLDEVCEMLPALQTKLLRFLQTSTVTPVGATKPRTVNVRIVCATNRDPLDAVRRGQFREDLYYRLFVVPLHMPPLRERANDMIEIAEAALMRFAEEEGRRFDGLTPEVEALFRAHPWPGNVRQLLNVIRNIVVLNPGGAVTPAMLPDGLVREMAENATTAVAPAGGPAAWTGMTLAQIERAAIESAIARHGGSVPKAARELDLSPSTLYRKLEGWRGEGAARVR
ncbi:MAG TPA: sigma-54 dependent transcriptional regulator [Paracoccaceae bacterium]|nr:sigma-54 dependent transcriptional regulator [Paracoccaceae bacterium]HMO72481.1 sigma-54 dependent transcriptional regulator [Paracoccaceae bacterium]